MIWAEKRLGDVLTLKRGYDLTEVQRKEGDVPVISSSGITGSHNVAMVSGPGVVTGRYGTMGEVFYIESDFWPHNTALYVRDFKGSDPRFVSYFLKQILRGTNSNKAAVPGVNRNDLHERRVCVPDVKTQKRIVERLMPLDDMIENNRRRMRLLEESAHLLYREWFVHLRFPGHEHVKVVNGVPDGWERKLLGELIKTSSGGTPSRKKSEFYGDGFLWVKTKELNGGFIFDTEEKITQAGLEGSAAKLFPAGTVLLAMYGATIGATAILGNPATTNQACCAFLVSDTKGLSYYCYQWLKEVKEVLVGMGMGAAQPNLSQDMIRKIDFLMPPKSLLSEFDDCVGASFRQIATLTQQNEKLAQARDLLLPRLMSGEIEV